MQETPFRSFLVPNCADCKILKEAVEATKHLPKPENELAIPHFISCKKTKVGLGITVPARNFGIIWKQKGFEQFVPANGRVTARTTSLTIYGLGRKCPHGYVEIPETSPTPSSL